jgi:hypothetical protein
MSIEQLLEVVLGKFSALELLHVQSSQNFPLHPSTLAASGSAVAASSSTERHHVTSGSSARALLH